MMVIVQLRNREKRLVEDFYARMERNAARDYQNERAAFYAIHAPRRYDPTSTEFHYMQFGTDLFEQINKVDDRRWILAHVAQWVHSPKILKWAMDDYRQNFRTADKKHLHPFAAFPSVLSVTGATSSFRALVQNRLNYFHIGPNEAWKYNSSMNGQYSHLLPTIGPGSYTPPPMQCGSIFLEVLLTESKKLIEWNYSQEGMSDAGSLWWQELVTTLDDPGSIITQAFDDAIVKLCTDMAPPYPSGVIQFTDGSTKKLTNPETAETTLQLVIDLHVKQVSFVAGYLAENIEIVDEILKQGTQFLPPEGRLTMLIESIFDGSDVTVIKPNGDTVNLFTLTPSPFRADVEKLQNALTERVAAARAAMEVGMRF